MTPKQFAALIDRFGADLARWPEADQGPAQALLARSDEAALLLRAESRLEAYFKAHDPVQAVDEDRVFRVVAAVQAQVQAQAKLQVRPAPAVRWRIPLFQRRAMPEALRFAGPFAVLAATAMLLGIYFDEMVSHRSAEASSAFPASIWINDL